MVLVSSQNLIVPIFKVIKKENRNPGNWLCKMQNTGKDRKRGFGQGWRISSG
jgi:hypothetical protein